MEQKKSLNKADILQYLSDIGKKVSEAKLPHIGSGKQRKMPTYTLDYNAFKRIPTPVSGPATWGLGIAGMGLAEAPILFLDNAVDTVVDGLPNVYNRAVDEYNAGASKRAYNNQMKNTPEDIKRKIQERGMGQIGRDPNTQTNQTWKALPIGRMYRYKKAENNIPRITL